jgi:hypothetical protein
MGQIETHQGNWYVLVLGIPKLTSPLVLAPGLTLRPLDDDLTVYDLAAAGAAGFKGWSLLEPLDPGCTCEFESARDADVTPGYDTLHRVWLASAMLSLRGFTEHFCVASNGYSWNRIAGHQRRSSPEFKKQAANEGLEKAVYEPRTALPPFTGQLLDFHIRYLHTKHHRDSQVTQTDELWIRAEYESFNQLAAVSEPFRFALEAAVDWRFSTDARSAVARLWSGIESLFGIQSELVYRISIHVACLLAPRGEARRAMFEHVKDLYGLRSKVVHGVNMKSEKIQVAMDDSFELLRDLLVYCIDAGGVPSNDELMDSLLG